MIHCHENLLLTLCRDTELAAHVNSRATVVQGERKLWSNYREPKNKASLVGGLNPSEKYESQLGWLFPIYGKINHVPNHQPAHISNVPLWKTTTQWSFLWCVKCNKISQLSHQTCSIIPSSDRWTVYFLVAQVSIAKAPTLERVSKADQYLACPASKRCNALKQWLIMVNYYLN